jgi:hypothetical protein
MLRRRGYSVRLFKTLHTINTAKRRVKRAGLPRPIRKAKWIAGVVNPLALNSMVGNHQLARKPPGLHSGSWAPAQPGLVGQVCRYMLCVARSGSPAAFVDEAAKPIPALHPRRP